VFLLLLCIPIVWIARRSSEAAVVKEAPETT